MVIFLAIVLKIIHARLYKYLMGSHTMQVRNIGGLNLVVLGRLPNSLFFPSTVICMCHVMSDINHSTHTNLIKTVIGQINVADSTSPF
jgi:hypothetical protein